LAALGPRRGADAQRAAEWIRGQSGRELQERLAQGPIPADNAGGPPAEIRPDDVRFEMILPKGWQAVEEGDLGILLDTTMTEELRQQGRLREVVHRIQMMRKEAGLEVTDRIVLRCTGDGRLCALLEAERAHVEDELLATMIDDRAAEDLAFHRALDVEGAVLSVGLERAPGSDET
jgi:isoleucyl-tRNA synthetase